MNLPTGIVSGDLLIAEICLASNTALTSPAGWTDLNGATFGAALRYRVLYKVATGSEGPTATATTSASTGSSHVTYRIGTETYAGTPEDGGPITSNTANPNPPSLTPTWGAKNTLWISVECNETETVTVSSYPTNYGNGINAVSTHVGGTAIGVARRELNAASEDPGTYTIGSSVKTISDNVAVQPAPAASPVRHRAPIVIGQSKIQPSGDLNISSVENRRHMRFATLFPLAPPAVQNAATEVRTVGQFKLLVSESKKDFPSSPPGSASPGRGTGGRRLRPPRGGRSSW